jgi:tol-pal system protein YbgF
MKLVRITCILLAAMPLSFGASKEIIELQRDVAQLQEQVRAMQKSLDQLTLLTQQALDVGNRSNTSLAVMDRAMTETTKQIQQAVSAPIMAVGTKVDSLSEDYRNLRENVNDLGARMGKFDAKMTDLINLVSLLKTQAPAPPPQPGMENPVTPGSQPPVTGVPAPATPPAGLKSEKLYSDAVRDYTGGTYDVALSEFTDYVKYFNETQFAPNAQFYIGSIYYKKQDYPNALQSFDAVLEHYSDNPKTASAHYWKGKTLLAMGKRDAAAKEFREVISKYPSSDVVNAARTELRNLGLSSGEAAPTKGRPRRR